MISRQSVCASCGEPIYWLQHLLTHRAAPIEVKQDPTGNIAIHLDRGTYEIVLAEDRSAFAGFLHLNHFATCPQAKTWAKAGKGRA